MTSKTNTPKFSVGDKVIPLIGALKGKVTTIQIVRNKSHGLYEGFYELDSVVGIYAEAELEAATAENLGNLEASEYGFKIGDKFKIKHIPGAEHMVERHVNDIFEITGFEQWQHMTKPLTNGGTTEVKYKNIDSSKPKSYWCPGLGDIEKVQTEAFGKRVEIKAEEIKKQEIKPSAICFNRQLIKSIFIQSEGKFISAVFTKANGETRLINARVESVFDDYAYVKEVGTSNIRTITFSRLKFLKAVNLEINFK